MAATQLSYPPPELCRVMSAASITSGRAGASPACSRWDVVEFQKGGEGSEAQLASGLGSLSFRTSFQMR